MVEIGPIKDTNLTLPNLINDDGMDRCSTGSRSSCVSPVSSQGGVYTVIGIYKFLCLKVRSHWS